MSSQPLSAFSSALHRTGKAGIAENPMQLEGLARRALDALGGHIAILDREGSILAVNLAWRQFGWANGFSGLGYGVGMNYLAVCEAARGPGEEYAKKAAEGIRAVIGGQRDEFYLEYPCHSPDAER